MVIYKPPPIIHNQLYLKACDHSDKKNKKLSYRWQTSRRV